MATVIIAMVLMVIGFCIFIACAAYAAAVLTAWSIWWGIKLLFACLVYGGEIWLLFKILDKSYNFIRIRSLKYDLKHHTNQSLTKLKAFVQGVFFIFLLNAAAFVVVLVIINTQHYHVTAYNWNLFKYNLIRCIPYWIINAIFLGWIFIEMKKDKQRKEAIISKDNSNGE